MATPEQVKAALLNSSLASRADQILGTCREALELSTYPTEMDRLPLGSSRIGGIPDLPVGTAWPSWRGEPQSFLAQISLTEVARSPGTGILPEAGSLCFFYSARQDTWGFDPKDLGSWAVVHTPPETDLIRTQPPTPIPDGGAFRPQAIDCVPSLSLPAWESNDRARLGLGNPELDAYLDLMDLLAAGESHQLLGHPNQVQGDMAVECELVSNGVFLGDSAGWEDSRAEALRSGWPKWRLLFQVASDEKAGMMWGDLGFLFFWIPVEALSAGDFDAVWLVLQCS